MSDHVPSTLFLMITTWLSCKGSKIFRNPIESHMTIVGRLPFQKSLTIERWYQQLFRRIWFTTVQIVSSKHSKKMLTEWEFGSLAKSLVHVHADCHDSVWIAGSCIGTTCGKAEESLPRTHACKLYQYRFDHNIAYPFWQSLL